MGKADFGNPDARGEKTGRRFSSSPSQPASHDRDDAQHSTRNSQLGTRNSESAIRNPESPERRPFTVSELTQTIKRLLETQVGRVEVEGEIGNWTVSSRGHAYFALKDAQAVVSCVLFKGALSRVSFKPADGMSVVAVGDVSVYEARGQYQLIVSALRQTGLGDLYRRFVELRDRLEKEGLFAPERKRPIPAFPRRIGVVTSSTGAALRDILQVIRRRMPCVEIVLSPTLVQGADAPAEIVRAIERLNRLGTPDAARRGLEPVDVMIVGRGGGSMEDLWAFNDERVARAIQASRVPVISAVGHEVDFTIADFVADLRAPTPSAAAEVVVAEIGAVSDRLAQARQRMARVLRHLVESRRLELGRLVRSWGLRQPLDLVRQATQRLDDLAVRRRVAMDRAAIQARHRIESLAGRLAALDPEGVLSRGYSIVSRARDGRVVTRESQVRIGDHLAIRLSRGGLRAAVLPQGEDFLDGLTDAK